MLFEEEGVKPTLAALNNILSGIQSRELVMWLGVQYVGNKRIMLGFFITSKYVGGPAGSQFLHISYLRGLEQLPEEVWQEGFSTVMRHAISEGCNALVATTRHKHIVDIAKKLGAQIDNRIIWRI